ncbi:hypothetical protein P3294_07085 [Campylobacter jejuni]|uniref:hypothetical protein n=2 Tax=Campylobacteraceae TaxID=72294 RepID=UPI000258A690|nr:MULTISPECIES: hypothetical protein [Campylobacter]PCM53604.1 hypothetical protein CP501_00495 [Campylobacter sp. BCW_8709]EAK1145219.1 hypothetical protein [Campylobacter jejuni]EAL9887901.1 hypothetical protein [Campylobacter jejuni]ECO2184701.1 hypothetical protein [Campylobacter jejuni]EIB47295.1 hypothetical protein cje146_06255 [Campylobacter jejuni subsp. jejuni 2008-894]
MDMNSVMYFIKLMKKGINSFHEISKEILTLDLLEIYNLMLQKNTTEICNFWTKKAMKNYLSFFHPLYPVWTKAVYSFSSKDDKINYIFFNDKTNRFLWIIIQTRSAIDFILVEDKIIRFPYSDNIFDISSLESLSSEVFKYREVDFGFIINHPTPWHFFYDKLCYCMNIQCDKKILDYNLFYIPNKLKNRLSSDKNLVYIYPHTVSIHSVENQYVREIDISREEIYKEIKQYDKFFDFDLRNNNIIIWIGMVWRNGEMKTWLNQFEAIYLVLKELQKSYKNICVYIDGNRSYENNFMSNNLDPLILPFINKLKKVATEVISLNNLSIKKHQFIV